MSDMCEKVLPSIREKQGEFMLRELVKRWANHKVMVRWLLRFFHYLDRYFISWRSLPGLSEVGLYCFRDLVYEELEVKVRAAVIALIDQERVGEQIERALLKNVLDIFVEIGMNQMICYETDFEGPMLDDSSCYYSRKASNWIVEDSCPDYMIKAEECLKKEKDRVSHHLHSSSESKLEERVQNELLGVHSNQLLEKEHSGCRALLRDDKMDDLSRMYRLFCKIPKGFDPIANIFREHVTAEGTALVQQAEDATSNRVDNAAGSPDQAFIKKVIDLHDKFMAYVMDCFASNSLFHKALKEAFEVFSNKQVSGSSSAELLASFCDNILKKGGSERLSDEAIRETLDKVVKLLAYISDKDLFAEFYRKKLSRRLLFDKSANDDHERIILTKLKQQCGGLFTSKMEGMVSESRSPFCKSLTSSDASTHGGFSVLRRYADECLPPLDMTRQPPTQLKTNMVPGSPDSFVLTWDGVTNMVYPGAMHSWNSVVPRVLNGSKCGRLNIYLKEEDTLCYCPKKDYERNYKFPIQDERISHLLPAFYQDMMGRVYSKKLELVEALSEEFERTYGMKTQVHATTGKKKHRRSLLQ